MRTNITISIDIEHLKIIDDILHKGEPRSHFIIKAALQEAIKRKDNIKNGESSI